MGVVLYLFEHDDWSWNENFFTRCNQSLCQIGSYQALVGCNIMKFLKMIELEQKILMRYYMGTSER